MKQSAVTNSDNCPNAGILGLRLALCLVVLALAIASPQKLHAMDADNCLMCHRFRGLARVDKEGAYRLFYVDEKLFSHGPHARVSCKGCHADIEKIPHNDAKPVDCLRSCHIEEPTREIIFTHAEVNKSLEDSVHALVEPHETARDFPEDFPVCKDCHDMPLFRPVAMFKKVKSGVSERAVSRCLVCHSDERFIRYYYSHVTTRLHRARDPREVVNMCATCHADAELAARHNLPDVVSSYLETQHGKAVLLGSSTAPDCLDCHARQKHVHEMHAKDDPRSSVHPENRSATCNTEDCHTSASPALASFDVHANRDVRTHTLEFGVGLFFVIMTLSILLPVLTLSILGQIRELFPSREAEKEIEHLTKLAEKKAAREGGIMRFTGAQRLQHAFLAIVFFVLCLTGFPIKFPQAWWAPAVFDLFGGIEGAPIVHRVAGVVLLLGLALHAVLVLLDIKRSLAQKGEKGLLVWGKAILALPMIPNWRDLTELIAWTKYVFFLSPHRPKYGRFSWKEKLEYLGIFWGVPLVGLTGILLWAESLSSHVIPGWLLNVAYLIHTYESFLAMAHIALIHMPGVIGRPGMSPLSSMVLNGKISPRVLAEEHGGEVAGWSTGKEVAS